MPGQPFQMPASLKLHFSIQPIVRSDNIQMHQLTPALKPFHVVNITLNLVSGNRLAWQQRKAESFTVTSKMLSVLAV